MKFAQNNHPTHLFGTWEYVLIHELHAQPKVRIAEKPKKNLVGHIFEIDSSYFLKLHNSNDSSIASRCTNQKDAFSSLTWQLGKLQQNGRTQLSNWQIEMFGIFGKC